MFATGDKTQTASMWTHAITLANWTTKIHLLSCRKNKREFMQIFIQQNSQWRDIKHETETYSLTVCFTSSPRVGHPEFRNVPREASKETGSGAGNHHQLWVAAEQQRRSISLTKHWVEGLVCFLNKWFIMLAASCRTPAAPQPSTLSHLRPRRGE